VGGIHSDVSEQVLTDYFAQYGKIKNVKIVRDKIKGYSLGYGFVTCKNKETTERLKKAKNLELYGRKLDIGEAAQHWESEEVKLKISLRKVYLSGLTPQITEGTII
jgi:RNA recognition motif-containing protein